MADPSAYSPSYNFSGYQTANPSSPLPAAQIDTQFEDIATSTEELRDALLDIRRSDGALANGSVGPDQISAALSLGFTLRGAWADGEEYSGGDGIVFEETFYKAKSAHTAATGSEPDISPELYEFLFTFSAISTPDGSITPAKLSADAAGFRTKIGLGALAVEDEDFIGSSLVASTEKTSIADDDLFELIDSEGFDERKKLKWSTVKAEVQTEVVDAVVTGATHNATPDNADKLLSWDVSAGDWAYSLWSELKSAILTAWGPLVAALTSKATGVNADGFAIFDSAAANVTRKMTFTNFWTNYIKVKVDALSLNASNIGSGTLADARLSSTAQNLLAPTEGTVGTYCFARDVSGVARTFGQTRAGSSLRPCNSDDAPISFGSALSGTWRCVGQHDGGAGDQSITLWVRIV